MATEILHCGFNQDAGCFAVGTSAGFKVFNAEPFKETFCRGFNNGGIGIVEMLFRCNILAIVGGGAAPKYPPTKVMIWDDHQGKCIGELSFRSQVRAVRLRRDRIIVALEHKVLVYNFADLKLLHQIETLANVKGLVAVSSSADSTVLACPGLHTGQVRIELYDRRQTKFISAHTNALSCLALSMEGKRLVTASEKGTLLRVWNTVDGQMIQELRRGADSALIHSLALSRGCEWLAVSSDKGTVHVFALSESVATQGEEVPAIDGPEAGAAYEGDGRGGGERRQQRRRGAGRPHAQAQHHVDVQEGQGGLFPVWSAGVRQPWPSACVATRKPGLRDAEPQGLVPVIPLPKYFTSEWSFAQFRVHEEQREGLRSVVGFGPQPHTLVIITSTGSFYRVSFDPAKGGLCHQDSFCKYVDNAATE
ncbi:MAG: hypothetical protein WDW38_001531 [Sanguina aurantia]